ncbi:MAG: S41 family peptidase [Peptococcaceae bacterium]|nr:S41 family peptidase [Peptococcaceae bacterium]
MRDSYGRNSGKKQLCTVIVVLVVVLAGITGAAAGAVALNVHHLGNFVRVWQLVHSDYLDDASMDTLVVGATKGIVESLGDPYSVFLDAKENQQLMEQVQGKFGGIGIVLNNDAQKLVVLRTIKHAPAEKAGLQIGDEIVRIDDTDVSGISQQQAIDRMRGDPGTQVSLGLYRESDGQSISVQLTREVIVVPTVEAKILPGQPAFAYIAISQFSAETGEEFDEVLQTQEVKSCNGMILDLRNNHGGELNAAVQAASHLIPPGPVVYIVDKNGGVDTRMTQENAVYWGKPLVVLVNGESASAAEILAGAIKDRAAGLLVGEKTFGKGIVQTIFQLADNAGVKLTTAQYLTPNKNDIHKIGIEPDITISLDPGQIATLSPSDQNYDAQLQKGVSVLRTMIK